MCRLAPIFTLDGPWLRLDALCAGTPPPPPMRGLDMGHDADEAQGDLRDERIERRHEEHDRYVRDDD